MSTCPPLAVDRLIGLAGVSPSLVKAMEQQQRLPPRMKPSLLAENLEKIGTIIEKMADPDIFVWIGRAEPPLKQRFTVRPQLLPTGFAAVLQIQLFVTLKNADNLPMSQNGWKHAVTPSYPSAITVRFEKCLLALTHSA